MNKPNTSMPDQEHLVWRDRLGAWQQDVETLQRELERRSGQAGTDAARLAQFHDRLIRDQGMIDELRQLVNTHEATHTPEANGDPLADGAEHDPLRERMRTAALLHADLRLEFSLWSSGHATPSDELTHIGKAGKGMGGTDDMGGAA